MEIKGWVIVAKSRESDDIRTFHATLPHAKRTCRLIKKALDETARVVPATLTIHDMVDRAIVTLKRNGRFGKQVTTEEA